MFDRFDPAGGGDASLQRISALYVHMPFCRAKCAYCDFDSRALCGVHTENVERAYVQSLLKRIDAFGERGALSYIKTVYIGGGTPSVLGSLLLDVVERIRYWCNPSEFTCEANPESFSESLACSLRDRGVTRVSLGVQSLDNAELKAIGRLHDADTALDALALARSAGFSTSIDLMCGIPLQTKKSWNDTVETAIAAGPDHVSIYPLTLEEGTPLARRACLDPSLEPDEDFQADCMEQARLMLMEVGYAPYEVASYAKRGCQARHNIAYWIGESYLGLGRSASSMLRACEFMQLKDLFCDARISHDAARIRLRQTDDEASAFEVESLSSRASAAEDLMLGCRMTQGIGRGLLDLVKRYIPEGELNETCELAVAQGLATWKDARLKPTHSGWLEGNVLFELFWGLS